MWNPFYAVGYYFADKYRRTFLISYAVLVSIIGAIGLLLAHAHHYIGQPFCSDDFDGRKSLNCHIADTTASISSNLIVLCMVLVVFILPHASHILRWIAIWAAIGSVWPLLRDVAMVFWQYKKHIGAALIWLFVFLVAKWANEVGEGMTGSFLDASANWTSTNASNRLEL